MASLSADGAGFRSDLEVQSGVAAANFANAVLTVVVAACITAIPVFAHLLHPAVGVLSAVLLAGLCAWRMPQVAIVAIIFALLFQNTFVSLVADYVVSDDDFDVIRGYNFVTISVTWLVLTATFLANWTRRNTAIDPFVKVLAALFVILGVYFLLGFAFYGITAIVYLRNIVTPLLHLPDLLARLPQPADSAEPGDDRPVRPGARVWFRRVLLARRMARPHQWLRLLGALGRPELRHHGL